MPDKTFETVSASQAPALFNSSPYFTLWMLHHAFRMRDLSMLEPDPDDRIDWGKSLQRPILEAVGRAYRLEMSHNDTDEYARDGLLGATVDGRMVMPDRGRVTVEVKNIDWLRWKQTWTETAAAPHVEIQLQTQVLVDKAEVGMIAALVGGNDLKIHERDPNRELHEQLKDGAARFFDDLKAGKEPDPLGSPLELPMLAYLYPVSEAKTVLNALDDEELAITIRQYARAKSEESSAKKLKEQMLAKLLTRAGAAGTVYAPGYTVYIKRTEVAAGICAPHAEPKVTRKASVRTNVDVIDGAPTAPATSSAAERDPADYLRA